MRFAFVRLLAGVRSLLACRRGQVAIIFAFSLMVLIIAVGMGIDMWRAYVVKARLQSAVDAAALALASTDRTSYPNPQDPFLVGRVKAFVTANYPASAFGTPGTPTLSYGATNDIIIVSDTANLPTTFMRIIGKDTLSVAATGQAKAAWSNIDFYLLLDSSPSMGIAANAAGIGTMVANTLQQCDQPPAGSANATCGCGFACHETTPATDSSCASLWSSTVSYAVNNYVFLSSNNTTYVAKMANKNHTPPNTTYWTQVGNLGANSCNVPGLGNAGGIDNYTLARNLGVTLRLDDLKTAITSTDPSNPGLLLTAQNTEAQYNLTDAFRVAIYTFDVNFNTNVLPSPPSSDLSAGGTVATAVGNIQQLLMCYNNVTSINGTCTSNSDADTNYANAMTQINAVMPNPGSGTQSPGDTPKEVLMLVTDGVVDEAVTTCPTPSPFSNYKCDGAIGTKTRQMSVIDTTRCDTIKSRKILIAVLYLEYDPLPTNSWYNTYVSPFNQPPPPTGIPPATPTPVETALQNCASSTQTGVLYAKVIEGADISTALSNLFTQAANAVYLSK